MTMTINYTDLKIIFNLEFDFTIQTFKTEIAIKKLRNVLSIKMIKKISYVMKVMTVEVRILALSMDSFVK